MKTQRNIAITCLYLLCFFDSYSQCPPNIDFEFGGFTNWECKTGKAINAGGSNEVNWTGGFSQASHEIIPATNLELDPFGNFPKHCPNSSGYSIRLGNDFTGAEAESVSYTFTIPPDNNSFIFVYYYAIVFQDPNHNSVEQPRFIARVLDVSTFLGKEISCSSFDFTSSAALPGFKTSSSGVVYKDWTPITVDLSGYAGKKVKIEFITEDCTLGGHFGYAYVDINSRCSNLFELNFCLGDPDLNLNGPFGFQSYQWYSDVSFSQLIGTSQNIIVSPSNVGSTFALIVSPFPGFGCKDTLFAPINEKQKPVSRAGPDQTVCYKEQIQLGDNAVSNYSYGWTPLNLVDNSTKSNPLTKAQLAGPTLFIVKTTDLASGCFTFDTTLITPMKIDTSITMTGKTSYCADEPLNTFFTVSSSLDAVKWHRENSVIPNASSFSYSPTSAGNYWATVFQNGCTDTTRMYTILRVPRLKADFSTNKEVQCINNPVHFFNKSTAPGAPPLTYLWEFSDGTSSTDINFDKSFNTLGIHSVKLVAYLDGCADSTERTFTIVNDCRPLVPTAFTPNNDGLNDRIKILGAGIQTLKRFVIYNRWGQIVFSTTNENESWDGTVKGQKASTGMYVWMIEYTTTENKPAIEKGTLTLIR